MPARQRPEHLPDKDFNVSQLYRHFRLAHGICAEPSIMMQARASRDDRGHGRGPRDDRPRDDRPKGDEKGSDEAKAPEAAKNDAATDEAKPAKAASDDKPAPAEGDDS